MVRMTHKSASVLLAVLIVAAVAVVPIAVAYHETSFDGFEDESADNGAPEYWISTDDADTWVINKPSVCAEGDQCTRLLDGGGENLYADTADSKDHTTGKITLYWKANGGGNDVTSYQELYVRNGSTGTVLVFEMQPSSGDLRRYHESNNSYSVLETNVNDAWIYVTIGSWTATEATVTYDVVNQSGKDGSYTITHNMGGYNAPMARAIGGSTGQVWFDSVNLGDVQYNVNREFNGTVTDQDGKQIENATITVRSNGTVVATTTSDINGYYEVDVPGQSDDYNLTASKDGYGNDTATVDSSTFHATRDFTLIEDAEKLRLEAPSLLEHGKTGSYSVIFKERNNTTGEIETTDVTSSAVVSSGNTNALTVDTVAEELVATQNDSINVQVVVTANYTTGGETYTTTKNVTVAEMSLSNIGILPGAYRIQATFADNPDAKDDPTEGVNPMFAILISTLVGVVGARFSSSFGGLALMTIALIVAWFGGWVGTGMMLVSIMTGSFIGLNVAANIDYGVISQ